MTNADYRSLPSVDRLLADPALVELAAVYGQQRVTAQARTALESARRAIADGEAAPDAAAVAAQAVAAITADLRSGLRPVINATGVIIHTNLGRAPLSRAALAAVQAAAQGYSNLEYDLDAGERGSRHSHIERLLTELTGAEAAMVVNNNASAVLLGLSAVGRGKEVIVSRGHAVEIGGGFRIPDVLRQSGAHLVEVGTTNRTYVADYDAALTHESAGFLRVHSSNFRVIGFTHEAGVGELAALAAKRGVLLLDDLGSGALLDTSAYGLAREPLVQESVAAGADLVFFSGDKLLGGPQAGIIVGKRVQVDRLKRHPLARAVRIDKLSLAALAATLGHYLRGDATREVPVWRMIATPLEDVAARADAWAAQLGAGAEVVDTRSMVGGGSLPEESLPSRAVALGAAGLGLPVAEAAARLRSAEPSVVARIEHDRLLLDPRTVQPDEDVALLQVLATHLQR